MIPIVILYRLLLQLNICLVKYILKSLKTYCMNDNYLSTLTLKVVRYKKIENVMSTILIYRQFVKKIQYFSLEIRK